jgi:hypothetical protein
LKRNGRSPPQRAATAGPSASREPVPEEQELTVVVEERAHPELSVVLLGVLLVGDGEARDEGGKWLS